MKKLYIGCALTNLPAEKRDEFMQGIAKIKTELKKSFEILEFVGVDDLKTNTPTTPQYVYNYDIRECLMKADYFLAICDFPAIGLGYELGTAVEKMGIPVLAMAHKDSKVSRSIVGVDHPSFCFARYDSLDEVAIKALEFFPK